MVFLWTLAYLVSGAWPPEQFQAWVSSHGVGLKSTQTVVGHSDNVYAVIAPA